jgi:hypothetical protein
VSDTKKPEGQPEEPAKPVVPDSLEELLGHFSNAPEIEKDIEAAQSAAKSKAAKALPPKAKPKKGEIQPKGEHKQPHPKQVEAVSTHVRQTVVNVLKTLAPAVYEEYVKRKFAGVVQGDRPSLEQSQAAYLWAFEQFLKLTYKKSGV